LLCLLRRQHPKPAMHLLGGIWIASCPTCGYQLVSARTQARCQPGVAAPSAIRTPRHEPGAAHPGRDRCVWDANPRRRFLIGPIAQLGFEVAILVRHGAPAVVAWTRGAG
jgi:hypothetical protein